MPVPGADAVPVSYTQLDGYKRQDFDSEKDGCVTVRDRDSREQERVKIDELEAYIAEKIDF